MHSKPSGNDKRIRVCAIKNEAQSKHALSYKKVPYVIKIIGQPLIWIL